MTFSLFGKKGEPQPKKDSPEARDGEPKKGATDPGGTASGKGPDKAVAKPPAPPPILGKESVPDAGDDLSLDFTSYVPPAGAELPASPGKPAPAAGRTPPAAPAPPAPLKKPAPAADLPPRKVPAAEQEPAPAPRPAEKPAPPPRPAEKPAPAPRPAEKPAQALPQAPARAEQKAGAEPRAQAAPGEPAPVVVEAARLFGAGEVWQALAALTKALREDELGPSPAQGWLMLFELYQQLGMKADFELLALQFAVEFERSPPAWVEDRTRLDASEVGGDGGSLELKGRLSEEQADQFERLYRAAQGQQALRIDLKGVEGIDAGGSARLLEALVLLGSQGMQLSFAGEDRLLGLLEEQCETGRHDTDGAFWSLLFEMLRLLGMEERFEEAAVNYAVTYEVSPPSWERPQGSQQKAGAKDASVEPAEPALRLQGELLGASESLPKKLRDWAAHNAPVLVDLSRVRRIDADAAAQLLSLFVQLHRKGASIELRGVNELIAVLLEVTGIGAVARIVRRS